MSNNNNNCEQRGSCLTKTRNRFHNIAHYFGFTNRTARNQREYNNAVRRELESNSRKPTAAASAQWKPQARQVLPTLLEEQEAREEKRGYDEAIAIAGRILGTEYTTELQKSKAVLTQSQIRVFNQYRMSHGVSTYVDEPKINFDRIYTAIRFIRGKLGIPGDELPIGRNAPINYATRVRNAEEAKLSDINVLKIAIGIITKIQKQVRREINTIPYGQKHVIAGAERAFAHINTIYDDITERLRVQEAIAQRAQMTQMQAAQQEQMAAAAAAEAARAARAQQAQYAASAAAVWAPSSGAESRRRGHSPPPRRYGGSKKNTRKVKNTRKIRR